MTTNSSSVHNQRATNWHFILTAPGFLNILSGCCLFLILTGCQGLSERRHSKPPPPVTAAEWNETQYKILVQQVAALSVTEAQLQAECRAYRQREVVKSVNDGKFRPVPPCASVSNDLENAQYLLWRQERARVLLEQKTAHSQHTKTGN